MDYLGHSACHPTAKNGPSMWMSQSHLSGIEWIRTEQVRCPGLVKRCFNVIPPLGGVFQYRQFLSCWFYSVVQDIGKGWWLNPTSTDNLHVGTRGLYDSY
jgi:hypothetical protein